MSGLIEMVRRLDEKKRAMVLDAVEMGLEAVKDRKAIDEVLRLVRSSMEQKKN